MRSLLKSIFNAVALVFVFPLALVSGFGRLEALYVLGAQGLAIYPGLIGDYLRTAYYHLTLEHYPLNSRIQFGSFFAHSQARVGRGVYIGSYCILGRTFIGDRSQIASGVQILSGKQQHGRDVEGRLLGSEHGSFESIVIGCDCWIGAGAIVMAPIGNQATIGASSVVTSPIPAGSVAVGNPARVIRSAVEA
jgi:acetyltransferase-like isoleucine patch superfamily enzyme